MRVLKGYVDGGFLFFTGLFWFALVVCLWFLMFFVFDVDEGRRTACALLHGACRFAPGTNMEKLGEKISADPETAQVYRCGSTFGGTVRERSPQDICAGRRLQAKYSLREGCPSEGDIVNAFFSKIFLADFMICFCFGGRSVLFL